MKSLTIAIALILSISIPNQLRAQSWPPSQYFTTQYIWGGGFNICQSATWKLVFHEEFNGSHIDEDKWITYFPYTSDGSDEAFVTRSGDDQECVYMDANVTQEDGYLHLTSRYEPTTWYGVEKDYTSGMIHSRNPFTYHRGKFAMRCKLPYSYGAPNLWPAFWLFGGADDIDNSASEVDIFEFCGNHINTQNTSLHRYYDGARYSHSDSWDFSSNFHSEYHVFELEWDYYYMRWIVDGQIIRQQSSLITSAWNYVNGCFPAAGTYFNNPLFPHDGALLNVIVNTSISPQDGYCGGVAEPDVLSFPLDFDIDWIRIYERETDMHHPVLYGQEQAYLLPEKLELCQNEIMNIDFIGPAGNLIWTTGPGMVILDERQNSVRVKATSSGTLESWVHAVSTDAPMATAISKWI